MNKIDRLLELSENYYNGKMKNTTEYYELIKEIKYQLIMFQKYEIHKFRRKI